MMRPLLDRDLTRNMITAGMSTVHAVTNSQPVLDAVPKAGATDLRKSRGALGNVVLTSTNAAAALEQVMPEIARIGFMADSVRIPTPSVSLIILNVTFQSETLPDGTVSVERDAINAIYREAAEGEARGLLKFSDEQNVSADMLGENAAVVIEGVETHTRTGFMDLRVPCADARHGRRRETVRLPLTHVKVFGWYDNEMGSYTYRLGELTAARREEHVEARRAGRAARRRPSGVARSPASAEQPAQAVVERRLAERRVRPAGQLLQAQVRVPQAQLGDLAQRVGQRRPGGRGHQRRGRRRPAAPPPPPPAGRWPRRSWPAGWRSRAPCPARRAPPSAGRPRGRRARPAGRRPSASACCSRRCCGRARPA